jgi:cytochrome c1
MLKLPEELILKAEQAIQSDMLISEEKLCISCQYYQNAVETWKLITPFLI